MSEQHFQNKKRQKRTALLALSAHHRKTNGACLSAELMAALVEERCPADEKEQALAHLADCYHCYREWLTLHALRQQHVPGSKVLRFFSRPRNLAAFGTLFAAAASIVLFLNIRYPDSPQALHQEVTEPVLQLEKKPLELKWDKEEADLPAGRAEAPNKVEFGASRTPAEEGELSAPPLAPQPVPSAKKEIITGRQRAIAPQLEEEPARKSRTFSSAEVLPKLTIWKKEIAAGCRRGEQAEEYWIAREMEGELLLQSQLNETDRVRVQNIINTMEMENKGLHVFCSKINEALQQ